MGQASAHRGGPPGFAKRAPGSNGGLLEGGVEVPPKHLGAHDHAVLVASPGQEHQILLVPAGRPWSPLRHLLLVQMQPG